MSRKRLIAVALVGAIGLAVPAANAGVSVRSVGTGEYPVMRVTVLTSEPSSQAPRLRENGLAVRIDRTENLGAEKSVVLAIDRSQSMRGAPLAHAIAAARSFVELEAGRGPGRRGELRHEAPAPDRLLDRARRLRRRAEVDPGRLRPGDHALRRDRQVLERARERAARGARDDRRHRRERDSQLRFAGRRDRGRTQGRRVDLRRRHREPEVQPRPTPQARGGDGRRVPRHLVERHAERPVRGHRGRAQAHVDARLRDHGPPRGHRVPAGDLEGRRRRFRSRSRCRRASAPARPTRSRRTCSPRSSTSPSSARR